MKKSKIKARKTKISSPFEITAYKTERTAVAILMHWMREIIEKKNLDIGFPDVETSGIDRKMPDTVIYESRRSKKVLCVIEAKPPFFNIFNEEELKKPAWEKANKRKAKYFAITNFKSLIWFSTENVNALKKEDEQILNKYILSDIENLNEIEQTKYSEPIKRELEKFLIDLYFVFTGKKSEPKLPIDELLIWRLQEKIKTLSTYYESIIYDEFHKDFSFAKKLKKWFLEQEWSFSAQKEDFEKAARQTAYLLVNKILFYNLLQTKKPFKLDPLEIPKGLTKGALLQNTLQGYFNEVLKIDYETIYTTDFIDTIAFPDVKEVVKEIKDLVEILKRYDFSRLGYDVIGRIFEQLIPYDERHKLGQYFTNPDIVDLILKFCMKHEDEKILDPACGAGTFLVRAYQHKKLMNQRLKHEKILKTLWGIDIAKFPAHLSTINLSINDLSIEKNYPNIIQENFFTIRGSASGFELPERWRKVRAKTLKIEEREVVFPRWFDAIVGNPPYTRQEEIESTGVDKRKLIESAVKDFKNRKIADISKRAGIHAYFFVHGTKFLKDGGYFGFIVSNSWLDVDYGKGLQEFFLNNYKIITIIESKVERWFEDADINTCIIILQKCKNKKERDKNIVRFVYLKKPLRNFIPPAGDIWEKEIKRINKIDELKKTILAHNQLYENEELRVFPKKQKELWNEGFNYEKKKYVGSKWGKYLRAPEIFFKILEKGKGKLIKLGDIAEVRRGFTTGANEFFYLTEEEIKRRNIEKEFWMHKDKEGNWIPNYLIKSPKECKSIVADTKELKYRILIIHKDKKKLKGTNVLKYIKLGERQGFHKRPTCASRERWYEINQEYFPIIWQVNVRDRFISSLVSSDIYVDKMFYLVKPYKKKYILSVLLILNSTLTRLFLESDAMIMQGPSTLAVYMVQDLLNSLIIEPSKIEKYNTEIKKIFKEFSKRKIGNVFSELGTSSPEEVSLNKVKPDRRQLDKIIMGNILGLTEDEQLEVYRAVIDLVKSRIGKAKSIKNKKTKQGFNLNNIKETIIQKIKESP